MVWKFKKEMKDRLASERGALVKDWGGKTSVALVYPNKYAIGMGNLAVHSIYDLLNRRNDVVCERIFLPDDDKTQRPISIESSRTLSEFDIIAFTISFENDYLNILPILGSSKIPHRAEERCGSHPLLIAGGAAPTLNPNPLSYIFDAIFLGEFEAFHDGLTAILAEGLSRDELIEAFTSMKGVYTSRSECTPLVPEQICSGTISGKRFVRNLDEWHTQTVIYSDRAEFGRMHLIEIQRGCPHRCRFCATPPLYHPPRRRGFECIMEMVDAGISHRKRFGLIGSDILAHPDFLEIARSIHERGGTFSPSSVRVDAIDEQRTRLLRESGHRQIALGVEAGSERLRMSLGKPLTDEEILYATGLLAAGGIARIKLYLMIGLPDETDDDIASIADLSRAALGAMERATKKSGEQKSLALTLAPFIPKPNTPMENAPFAGEAYIKDSIKGIRALLKDERAIAISADSALSAAVEALIARGGSETLEFLEEAYRTDDIRQALNKGQP